MMLLKISLFKQAGKQTYENVGAILFNLLKHDQVSHQQLLEDNKVRNCIQLFPLSVGKDS